VADLRKLGKKGSYQLGSLAGGRLGGAPAPRSPRRLGQLGRAPHGPTFGPPRAQVRFGWWLAVVVAGAVVIAVTAEFGLWFVPFVAGLVTGLAAPRAGWRLRHTVPAVLVMAAAGWGAPLLWQSVRGAPAGATARVVAALAGLPPRAMIGVAFTLLIAALQAAVGLWLGCAVMGISSSR
jgi:hypothetical protein